MDNTYREAADPPEECSPENKKVTKSKEASVQERKTLASVAQTLTVMNIFNLLVLHYSSRCPPA